MMAGLVSALTAFLVALIVAGVMLRAGIIDRPNARSPSRVDPGLAALCARKLDFIQGRSLNGRRGWTNGVRSL